MSAVNDVFFYLFLLKHGGDQLVGLYLYNVKQHKFLASSPEPVTRWWFLTKTFNWADAKIPKTVKGLYNDASERYKYWEQLNFAWYHELGAKHSTNLNKPFCTWTHV